MPIPFTAIFPAVSLRTAYRHSQPVTCDWDSHSIEKFGSTTLALNIANPDTSPDRRSLDGGPGRRGDPEEEHSRACRCMGPPCERGQLLCRPLAQTVRDSLAVPGPRQGFLKSSCSIIVLVIGSSAVATRLFKRIDGIRDARCVLIFTGTRPSARYLRFARRSAPVVILPAFVAAGPRAGANVWAAIASSAASAAGSALAAHPVAVTVQVERVGRPHLDRTIDIVGAVPRSPGAVVVADPVVEARVRVGRIAVASRG